MMFDFTGRKAIITGGSRGIGRSIATHFLKAGALVSICGRSETALNEARIECKPFGALHIGVCDLADPVSIGTYIASAAVALGGIDILVNNASAFARSDTPDAWTKAFQTDVLGTWTACHESMPWLEKAADPSIVHITSIAGTRPSVTAPPYGAMKAALIHYTASQAAVLVKRGIRVNSVAPGSVTARGHFWEARKAQNDPSYEKAIATIPAGRLGEADEIADVVLFFASPAARWIYGQTLIVDGGQTLFGG
jgi:3-oxoacyl-[acyl-carrier protein] reductase